MHINCTCVSLKSDVEIKLELELELNNIVGRIRTRSDYFSQICITNNGPFALKLSDYL